MIFRRYFDDFTDFFPDRLSVANIFFVPADNLFFDDISAEKT